MTDSVTAIRQKGKNMTKQKIKLGETQRKALQFLMIAAFVNIFIFVPQLTVFAEEGATDGAAIVTGAFNNLIAIVTAMVSSIGAIILLWAFFEVGVSMQSQEGTMQAMGFKRVGGGLVMTLAPQLVNAILG